MAKPPPRPPLTIEVLRPSDLTPAQGKAWRALQADDPALDSPFLAPGWAEAVERAERAGRRDGRSPSRVAVVSTGGAGEAPSAKAFLPVRLDRFTAMPLGAPLCDVQGLVAAPDLALDPRELVRALGVGRLDFQHLPPGQPVLQRHASRHAVSRQVDLAAGYAAYEAERRAANGLIKDLAKRRRKAEREMGPVRFTAFSRSRSDFDALLAWKRERYLASGQPDVTAAPWARALLADLFERRDAEFCAGLFTLHIGERLAAAQLHLLSGRTVHAWMIGHACEAERVSPGLLLFQDLLRWMDGGPFSLLDFGHGDYDFKLRLANAERPLGEGFVGVASPAALVRSAEYRLRAAAERLPHQGVAGLPGKAMRRLDQWRGLR